MLDIVHASHRLKERFGSECDEIRPADATEADTQLGLRLPSAYVEFLQICNGVSIEFKVEQQSVPIFAFLPLERTDRYWANSVLGLHRYKQAGNAKYNTEEDAILGIGYDHMEQCIGFAIPALYKDCVDLPVYRAEEGGLLTQWAPSLTCLVNALADWDLHSEIEFVGEHIVYKESQTRPNLFRRLFGFFGH